MSEAPDLMHDIQLSWDKTTGKRVAEQKEIVDYHNDNMFRSASKLFDQHVANLTTDLDNLTNVIIGDFTEKFELSPSALIDLHTVVVSAVGCGAQLGADAGIAMTRLEPYMHPEDTQEFIDGAISDYNTGRVFLVKQIWNGVNN